MLNTDRFEQLFIKPSESVLREMQERVETVPNLNKQEELIEAKKEALKELEEEIYDLEKLPEEINKIFGGTGSRNHYNYFRNAADPYEGMIREEKNLLRT